MLFITMTFTLYRLIDSSQESSRDAKEIASTPAEIEKKLKEYNAVECKMDEFDAWYFTMVMPQSQSQEEGQDFIVKRYKTSVIGGGNDCDANFCLILVDTDLPYESKITSKNEKHFIFCT